MQFLKIEETTTLSSLASQVGSRNVDSVLIANGLSRVPDVGKAYYAKCKQASSSTSEVTSQRKASVLNTLTSDAEVFEEAALLGSDGWKILSSMNTLPGTLKIPEGIELKNSQSVIGGSGEGVSRSVYSRTMNSLKSSGKIDSSIFNTYDTGKARMQGKQNLGRTASSSSTDGIYNAFSFPWGKIQLYSSLAGDTIDFPVYPEEINDGRKASYTTMPDTIYQYEPWYTYENSGPREQTLTFTFHRDMWTGNHEDGNAQRLVRFCEANCYPEYKGSSVYTSTVELYINGSLFISGIMTSVDTKWSGPIGHDGWYLMCELSITITEVAKTPRTFSTVKSLGLIGE